jgi:hypothetical protein
MLLLQLVQVVYWLALSAWFGGTLFIAIAAQVIFRSVKESNPVLPDVLAVNLEGQHSTLLAGTIVGNLLSAMAKVQLSCAAVLLLMMIAQWLLLDLHNSWNLTSAFVRSAMYIAATVLVMYDWRIVWPRVAKYRKEFIDNADEPEKANPALEKFDQYQRESMTILSILLFLLLGIVLFSGGMGFTISVSPTHVGQ